MSRVTSVKKNGTTSASYTYDGFGNLVGVSQGGANYSYTYGYTGNIEYISKTVNGVTTAKDLQYDDDGVWKDRLIAVDGAELVYSDTAPGLPTTYQNGNTYQMTWDEYGRLGMLYNSTVGINAYQYDTNGLRTFKRSKNVNHYYYYDGDRLIAEKLTTGYLLFHYDENDSIFAITYNNGTSEYTYQLLKNLQGDVVAILNAANSVIATYEYDAWGNLLSIKNEYNVDITNSTGYFANINPIRYRGYYYDVETGFYYLQSRYYDPANARFISADEPTVVTDNSTVTDKNLFAYCDNDPINRFDDGGQFWNVIVGGLVGGVVGGLVSGVTSYVQTGKVDWASVGINAVSGAVSGLVAATGLGAFAQAGITAGVSGVSNFAEQCASKGLENVNYADVATSATLGGLTSLAGTAAGNILGKNLNNVGEELINKGRDKLLTGYLREAAGQSHSALMRQGRKYIAQGITKINTARGISSVVGTGISNATNIGYSHVKKRVLGW